MCVVSSRDPDALHKKKPPKKKLSRLWQDGGRQRARGAQFMWGNNQEDMGRIESAGRACAKSRCHLKCFGLCVGAVAQ